MSARDDDDIDEVALEKEIEEEGLKMDEAKVLADRTDNNER